MLVQALHLDMKLLELSSKLKALDHPATRRELMAERAFLERLGGDCSLPAGAYARTETTNRMTISGILGTPDENTVYRRTLIGADPQILGVELADELDGLVKSKDTSSIDRNGKTR